MIIQASALLEDLDKEINVYAMRVREWYGWHFPEMGKIIQDNLKYAQTVNLLSNKQRTNPKNRLNSFDSEKTLKEWICRPF